MENHRDLSDQGQISVESTKKIFFFCLKHENVLFHYCLKETILELHLS